MFERYNQELAHIPGIHFMPELENTQSNRWLTTLTIDEEVVGTSIASLLQSLG